MSANSVLNGQLILNVLICLGYLLIIALAARRIKGLASPAFWLVGYACLAFCTGLARLGVGGGFLPGKILDGQFQLEEYSSILLLLLLVQCLALFLGKEFRPFVFFWGLALSIGLIATGNRLLFFLAGLAVTTLAFVLLFRALAQTRQHLHRNRLFYWIPVLILATGNELSIFFREGLFANFLRLCLTLILAFLVLRHHVPDVREFVRQFCIHLGSILLSVVIYIVGLALMARFFRNLPDYDPVFTGIVLAAITLILYTPILGFARKLVNRQFSLHSYDSSLILRTYNASISNILDLDKLAGIAIATIGQVLKIEKGFLLLVDPEIGPEERKVFRLSGARGMGVFPGQDGVFDAESSIVRFLLEQSAPLLQYDLDFDPRFLDAPHSERKWLRELAMDIYVPIFANGEWIGLLALGPKPGNRYTGEDMNLLVTIASQTGVGLENARLVENLKRLNDQVREAYVSLDEASRKLANLEKTKSNFISIASHELRTPLTVARGYTEMLLEDETLAEDQHVLVIGIYKSLLRQHEIMDSLFDIVLLDSRLLELQRADLLISEIIGSVARELSKSAGERNQEIVLDLPQLPSINADPHSLRKLFHCLMINAIKFTPNNGKIRVTGGQLPPNNHDLPEGGVEIVISDTGVGVDRDYQEIIFTKFSQPGELLNLHSTGKTKFTGSGVGLGLALARGVVDAHGGRIWVESPGYDKEKCPGSDFHVVLPLRSQGESQTIRMSSSVKQKLT
jgi:signal transduction histidine kinase